MTPLRSVKLLSVAVFGISAACASATAAKEQTQLHGRYGFQSAPGVLPSTSSTVRCDGVCDRISDYDAFFGVARLAGGGFAALSRENHQSSSWQVGSSLSDVSVLEEWRSASREPGWIPAMPGFVLSHVVPLKESTDVFVGVWQPEKQPEGSRIVALFSDGETRQVLGVTGICIIASVEAPVLAVDSQASVHGEMWPVELIVRPPHADQAGVLGFLLFPDSIECSALPSD